MLPTRRRRRGRARRTRPAPHPPRTAARSAKPGQRQGTAAPGRHRGVRHTGLAPRGAPGRSSVRRRPARVAQGRTDVDDVRLLVARRQRRARRPAARRVVGIGRRGRSHDRDRRAAQHAGRSPAGDLSGAGVRVRSRRPRPDRPADPRRGVRRRRARRRHPRERHVCAGRRPPRHRPRHRQGRRARRDVRPDDRTGSGSAPRFGNELSGSDGVSVGCDAARPRAATTCGRAADVWCGWAASDFDGPDSEGRSRAATRGRLRTQHDGPGCGGRILQDVGRDRPSAAGGAR